MFVNHNYWTDLKVDFDEIDIQEEIGRGCFAVHKGLWKGNTVAVKKIPIPSGVSMEEVVAGNKEIAALKYEFECIHNVCHSLCLSLCRLLKHPNIVSLLGYTVSSSEVMLIMNFIEGKNLDSLIFGRPYLIRV